jgi:hypothetical protein
MSRRPRAPRQSAGVIFEITAINLFYHLRYFYQCRDSVPDPDNVPCSSEVNERAMPASRRQRKAPPPARTPTRRAGSNLTSLLLRIEQPLRDATHVVEALRLVGYGLILHDEAGGDAVAALAHIAAERLQVVEEKWNEVVEAKGREES